MLERLVLMSTDENDVVLDPFMGTGTTALAAKRLGRQYVGFEISKKYCEAANNKLLQETELSKLGDCWVSFYLDKVVTIRNNDWPNLRKHFTLPTNVTEINT